MTAAPALSIVMPARNAAATLPSALRSIVRQTWTDWECLVIDDGSSDGTSAVANHTAREDARIRVVRNAGGGLVAALNEGLRLARAPIVARMDADDLMHRDRLALQLRALSADPTLSGVGSHVRLFPRRSMTSRLREYEIWLNALRSADDVLRDAYVECPIAHPTLMMRRRMAELTYHDCGWPEDYDLVLRALGGGMRVGVVPRRLLSWRDRPSRTSRTDPRYSSRAFVACKAHHLAAGFLSRVDRYALWGYGSTGRSLSRALAAYGKRPSCIVEIKATRIGQRIQDAPVIPPDALRAGRREPLVVSVARREPRTEIRAALGGMGFIEGRDYVCAA